MTEAETEREAETEESLRSSVNHENGDGCTSGSSTEAETEGTDRFLFLPSPLLLPSCLRRKLPSVNQYCRKRKRRRKDEPMKMPFSSPSAKIPANMARFIIY